MQWVAWWTRIHSTETIVIYNICVAKFLCPAAISVSSSWFMIANNCSVGRNFQCKVFNCSGRHGQSVQKWALAAEDFSIANQNVLDNVLNFCWKLMPVSWVVSNMFWKEQRIYFEYAGTGCPGLRNNAQGAWLQPTNFGTGVVEVPNILSLKNKRSAAQSIACPIFWSVLFIIFNSLI